jgi:hypothetical protein
MDSIVFNVKVNTIDTDKYKSKPNISFIDYVVSNKDYVKIIYNYYEIHTQSTNNKLTNVRNYYSYWCSVAHIKYNSLITARYNM